MFSGAHPQQCAIRQLPGAAAGMHRFDRRPVAALLERGLRDLHLLQGFGRMFLQDGVVDFAGQLLGHPLPLQPGN